MVAILFFALRLQDLRLQVLFIVLAIVTGIPACGFLEEEFGEDPKQATMDEAAGMAIALLAVPLTPLNVFLAFVLFRLFDVLKPQPARWAERLPKGVGIMADDLIAGVYARAVMAVLLWLL